MLRGLAIGVLLALMSCSTSPSFKINDFAEYDLAVGPGSWTLSGYTIQGFQFNLFLGSWLNVGDVIPVYADLYITTNDAGLITLYSYDALMTNAIYVKRLCTNIFIVSNNTANYLVSFLCTNYINKSDYQITGQTSYIYVFFSYDKPETDKNNNGSRLGTYP